MCGMTREASRREAAKGAEIEREPFAPVISAREFLKALVDRGIVDGKVNRVVIEADLSGKAHPFVVVHSRNVGDERLLSVIEDLRLGEVDS